MMMRVVCDHPATGIPHPPLHALMVQAPPRRDLPPADTEEDRPWRPPLYALDCRTRSVHIPGGRTAAGSRATGGAGGGPDAMGVEGASCGRTATRTASTRNNSLMRRINRPTKWPHRFCLTRSDPHRTGPVGPTPKAPTQPQARVLKRHRSCPTKCSTVA